MIEDEPNENLEEALKFYENQYSTLSDEEKELEGIDFEYQSLLNEEEINEYCKIFSIIMQVELHKRYDLRSRKKIKSKKSK